MLGNSSSNADYVAFSKSILKLFGCKFGRSLINIEKNLKYVLDVLLGKRAYIVGIIASNYST